MPAKRWITYAMLGGCFVGQIALVHMQWVHYTEWKPAHEVVQKIREECVADLVRKDIDAYPNCSARWRAALQRKCLALKKEFIVAPDCAAYHFLD